MDSLEDIIKLLNKRYGQNEIIKGSELGALNIERISTGSLSLDVELGGGLPAGRLVEIFGREGSGKTAIALKTVAEAQKKGKKCVWIDLEGAYDPQWAKLLGVNIEDIYVARPDSGEKAADMLDAVVRSGDCGVVVLDSVAALIPNLDLSTAMEDKEKLGERAKLVNRIVRKIQSGLNTRVGEDKILNNCLVVFLNQIREKIGVLYGNPEVTPGGLGLKFHSSVRINLRRGEWIEEEGKKKIGQDIKFKITKNKTAPPMRTGQFTFFFEGERKGQVNRELEILKYSLLNGLVKLNGRTYTIDGKKIVGKKQLAEYLQENEKITERLEKELFKLLRIK